MIGYPILDVLKSLPFLARLPNVTVLWSLTTTDTLFSERTLYTDMENYKQACLENCSCKGARFLYDQNSSNGNCSLLSEVFSLK